MRFWLLVTIVLAAGCADRTRRTVLADRPEGAWVLTGRVRIEGDVRDLSGERQGGWRRDDASGVRVWLAGPNGWSDSTLTLDGAFAFGVNAPGRYRAYAWVVAPDTVAASSVTVTAADASFPDTLALGNSDSLRISPNPFPGDHGAGIEYDVPVSQTRLTVEVRSLRGAVLWSFSTRWDPGLLHVHWSGDDQNGAPVPAGLYWGVLLTEQGVHHAPMWKQ